MAFTYAPLEGNNAFRLLRLLGGEGDVVECELFHAHSDRSKLQYEAVSYCWGSQKSECAVLIDGKRLMIRESLSELLKNMRNPNPQKHRIIWIDAICIDQQNKVEQGHQVQQMRRIYASARRVIFWLGGMTSNVKLLLKTLDAFNRVAWSVGWRLLKDEVIERNIWNEVVEALKRGQSILDAPGRMREGLRHLLRRSWFRRAWIIQEVANARQGILQCGKMVIACRPFTLAAKLLGVEVDPHCRNVLDAMPTHLRTTSWWSGKRDLFSVIQKFRYSESTLDRDRIYALRGLCTFRDEKTFLGVDYNQPVQSVINDAVSHMCMCDRHSLPDSLYSSMGAFLNDLESMHLRVLISLLKSEKIQDVQKILKNHSASIRILPSMLNHAVSSNDHGRDLTKILLDFCKGQVEISESTILAACENVSQGSAVVSLLLPHAQNISPSSKLFNASARNPDHAGPILKALIRKFKSTKDIVTPELVYTIAVNKRARGELINVLSQELAIGFEITENLAVEAARNMDDLMNLDAYFQSGALAVSERMILAAMGNLTKGPMVIEYLLHNKTPNYFQITENLVAMVIDAIEGSPWISTSFSALRVLLDHRKEEISISDKVMKSILRNPEAKAILDLFQSHQGQIRMSQREWTAASLREEVCKPQHDTWVSLYPERQEILWWAIQNSQRALLEVLIRSGTDLLSHGSRFIFDDMVFFYGKPTPSNYIYPLYMACELGNMSIIKTLLQNGADINQSPSPLIAAMDNDQVFQFLLENGAQVNDELLISAAYFGNVSVVEFALDYPTEHVIDYSLIRAVQACQVSVVQVLLKAGARVDARIRDMYSQHATSFARHFTPLHWSVYHKSEINMDLVELLLQSGAGVNQTTGDGETPLYFAAKHRNWKLYERLLEAGADESTLPEDQRMGKNMFDL